MQCPDPESKNLPLAAAFRAILPSHCLAETTSATSLPCSAQGAPSPHHPHGGKASEMVWLSVT